MQGNQPGPYPYPIGVAQQPPQMYFPPNNMMAMPFPAMNKNQLDIKACLFVTDIGPYETDQSLYLHFSKFGDVVYVKIPRACAAKKNKYGFVYFRSKEEASKVKKEAHYSLLRGNEIRVIHYKSIEGAEKEFNNEANLFFKNVAPEINSKAIENFFAKFGEITSCKLAKDQNGDSLRYGYLQFSNKEAAKICMENYQQYCQEINSPELSVIQFIPRGQRPFEETTQNLYVRNLPVIDKETMEKNLKEIFLKFGEVKSVISNKAKEEFMYAFICFNESDEAQAAINSLNGSDPFATGTNISVELAKPRLEASHDPTNMYTKNLKREVGEPDIRRVFGKYGDIESIAVRTVENFNTRSAFIKYKNPASAGSLKAKSNNDQELKDLYEGEVYIETFKNKKEYDLFKKSRQIRTGFGNKMNPFYQYQQALMQQMAMGQGMMGNPMMGMGRGNMPMMNPMGFPQNPQNQGQRRMPPQQQMPMQPNMGPPGPMRGGRGGFRGGRPGMGMPHGRPDGMMGNVLMF